MCSTSDRKLKPDRFISRPHSLLQYMKHELRILMFAAKLRKHSGRSETLEDSGFCMDQMS
ncbi:hypothetical protein Mapa_004120 [Marchantia paleacea]|nr:hypothetical protein Mapa_004120 [Marchantia paleacea]